MDNSKKEQAPSSTGIGKVTDREIVEEMRTSYIDYAMSVIVARALPDVRDGLKPVHRRILYAMHDMGLTSGAKFRKSATVVGECFTKDTLILTDKGLIPIQDVVIGDRVYTQKELQRVVRLYEMPEKPLLKLTLDSGNFNTVTPSQQFKVLTPDWKFLWKDAKDLTENDYLVLRADYPEIKNYVSLENTKENQPHSLNENLAYLLGFFASEGWISKDYGKKKHSRIGFVNGSKATITRIASILEQEFGYHPTVEIRRNGNVKDELVNSRFRDIYAVRINRKTINEFLVSRFDLEGRWAFIKDIPSQIFVSPKSAIFAFISGLVDGDGSIHIKRNVIHYGSISERLIQRLQILLQHQGIFSQVYRSESRTGGMIGSHRIQARHPFFSLEIKGENALKLASQLKLSNPMRSQRVSRLAEKEYSNHERKGLHAYDLIPYAGKVLFGELTTHHLGSGWYEDANGYKFRMGIKYPDGTKIRYSSDLLEKPLRKTQILEWGMSRKLERINSPFFEFLHDIVENRIYFAKVRSVEQCPPQKTYDLEVENAHEFVANGVVSHNCLGKYHPHGDIAVYDSLARMAQNFSMRYPLIDGQGNFGSIDSDPPAAMRYTEARLAHVGEFMLQDIEKETVDFVDNYDGTRKEPAVLPSPLPQLLLNGTLGIAVGMATNIPPHNMAELLDALLYILENPRATTQDLFQFIKGPDFPTGGIIYNKQDIIAAYSQGKGPIVMRGKAEVQETEKHHQIVISEIPFEVNKSTLVEQFAQLVQDKKIDGIRDIRDESDKDGLRIVFDLQRDAQPQKILNRLYKFSDLQKTFHLNMLALVDGIQPKVLALTEVLSYFIEHRRSVVERRTAYDLKKAKEREHILEGLYKCLAKIDEVIKIIKASQDREDALRNLIKRFRLTEIQTNAILDMRLAQLAKLERKKIEDELKEIQATIKELSAILTSPKRIDGVIKKEFAQIRGAFGDERKTKVQVQGIGEIAEEDLVPQEETIITLTQGGYIKRINPATYKLQKRGGKGIMGMKTVAEDIVEHFLYCNTHDSLMVFTDSGKVFQTPVYEIPEGTRVAKGRGLLNFIELSSQDKVLSLFAFGKKDAESGIKYLVMITKDGIIKKTPLEDFKNARRSGLIAMSLKKGDLLRSVQKSTGQDELIITTRKGQSIHFREKDVRSMGRPAAGIHAMRLKKGDEVVGMDVISNPKSEARNPNTRYLFILMENGYGKRTDVKEYRIQTRGGSGIKTANVTAKTGNLVYAKVLQGIEEDLIVISRKGQVIRTPVDAIPKISRSTQGVRIMRLDEGDKVVSPATLC